LSVNVLLGLPYSLGHGLRGGGVLLSDVVLRLDRNGAVSIAVRHALDLIKQHSFSNPAQTSQQHAFLGFFLLHSAQ